MSARRAPSPGLVLLAAGASTRMGRPKQLLAFRGRTLLRGAAEGALASLCHPVVVVLGANAETIHPELHGLPLETVVNDAWAEGMGSSVRAGIAALEAVADVDSAVVMLCDQPFVTAGVIDRLVAAHARTGRPIAASEYEEALGVPALFHRSLFPALRALPGSAGARQLIARHPRSEVARVPLAHGAVDVDTPSDYGRLLARATALEAAWTRPLGAHEGRVGDEEGAASVR
jgi:molybdenum cofactor cytidylyltransferase